MFPSNPNSEIAPIQPYQKGRIVRRILRWVLAVIGLFIIVAAVLAYMKWRQNPTNTPSLEPVESTQQTTDVPFTTSQIPVATEPIPVATLLVTAPAENSLIKSPLTVSGFAPTDWFGEAGMRITVTNWDGLILREVTAKPGVTTDSMGRKAFSSTLSFTTPSFGVRGTIIIQGDNGQFYEYNVTFPGSELTK